MTSYYLRDFSCDVRSAETEITRETRGQILPVFFTKRRVASEGGDREKQSLLLHTYLPRRYAAPLPPPPN